MFVHKHKRKYGKFREKSMTITNGFESNALLIMREWGNKLVPRKHTEMDYLVK